MCVVTQGTEMCVRDYSATYDAVQSMVGSGEDYNLLTNNCLQKTLSAFLASDDRFRWVMHGRLTNNIPNTAARKVALMPSNKGSRPIGLIIYAMLEYFC